MPNNIYDCILNLDKEKFIEWHPTDHMISKIIKQSPAIKRNIFYFNELIGGKYKIDHKWQIADFKKKKMLLMKTQINHFLRIGQK